ncbi:MAG: VWA domain-containing protein [Coriobacteriales bacterium]|nr:VWA domain-containing protein [Coriobacteriales bacterium]
MSTYPFSAIVGQDTLKTALLINAVDPRVGGVLVRGEKGTAKSTAVRALAALLPPIETFGGCVVSCDPAHPESWCDSCGDPEREIREREKRPAPFIDLPLSATEDRLVGSMDLERVLTTGVRAFQPGLLAAANRGILYVDEVNLLDDHLVDTLLDVAAMGVNVIEREGLSVSHPSRFVLVGTMNPEEGDLRPQLLDRFGLCVDVAAMRDMASRVEIIRRREAFEADPAALADAFTRDEDVLRASIAHARARLGHLDRTDDILELVARLTIAAEVDGHRADHVITRAASALAALKSDDAVTARHVAEVAPLALVHRLRTSALTEPAQAAETIRVLVSGVCGAEAGEGSDAQGGMGVGLEAAGVHRATPAEAAEAETTAIADAVRDRIRRSTSGSTTPTFAADARGRYVRAEQQTPRASSEVAVDATVRAAASRQGDAKAGDLAVKVEAQDLRRAVRSKRCGATIVFAVDASGSMGALNRMEAAKSAVLSLLVDAYQRRDRVGLVSFRGDRASTLLSPTSSVELARLRLRTMDVGGSTPLAAGILTGLELLEAERRRDETVVPWLVMVTDGRANIGLEGGLGSEDARAAAARVRAAGVRSLLLDTAVGGSGAAREIATIAGAGYEVLNANTADALTSTVRRRVDRSRHHEGNPS